MPQLYDAYGNLVQPARLKEEESAPSLTGVRNILAEHPSRGLTPQRLTAILLEAEEGDATRYLELAEDMEEKDLHYLAQLNTRKRAVAQLQVTVEAASDSAEHVADADLLREWLRTDDLEESAVDILDAVGKGFSCCEIMWDVSGRTWMPYELRWRDPRWFGFDPADGTTLRLRDGAGLVPLTPYKYVVHVHKAKAGLPIRGGLARAAAWGFLFKNFTVKDWVQFAEVYGQPYRIGTYHPTASADDRSALLRAVASIGSDAAAIVPQGMAIEFKEAARSGSINLYKELCEFLDAQVSKAVVGQTLTSDVSSNGGSRALGEVHDKVRGDIMRADSRQLSATLNRCLVRPIIDLNRGPRTAYPRLRIGLPDELGTQAKIDNLVKLVPMGVRVEQSIVQDLLGFPDAPADAAVLTAPVAPPAQTAPAPGEADAHAQRAAHARGAAAERDAIDAAVDEIVGEQGDWQPLVDPLVDPVRQLLDEAGSMEEVRDRLAGLIVRMDVTRLRESLERGAFAAHVAGELEVELHARAEDA